MDCPECSRLTNAYEHLERIYIAALNGFTNRKATTPVREYRTLRAAVDIARRNCEVARTELLDHQKVHRMVNRTAHGSV
jgi:hypothetical protein